MSKEHTRGGALLLASSAPHLDPSLHFSHQDGVELGEATDTVFARVNSKHHDGTVGILTGGLIGRSEYYQHALILALIPFLPHNRPLFAPAKPPAGAEAAADGAAAAGAASEASLPTPLPPPAATPPVGGFGSNKSGDEW